MLQVADQEVRERVARDKESFHLEAPAGSGKTTVLLARFLTLLARIEDTPREILTLTFTRKAAGEFRERVMRYLRPQKGGEQDFLPHEHELLELAREAFRHLEGKNLVHQFLLVPERLPITTFHAFCAQLLQAAPHEAGVPLGFTILESELEADWLKQEALEALRRKLGTRPPSDPVRQALVNRLLRLNNNWPRLAGELRSLLGRRDTLRDFLALARQSLEESCYETLMAERLGKMIGSLLSPLAEGLKQTEIYRRWPEFLRAAAPDGAWPEEPPSALPQDLSLWKGLAEVLLTQQGTLRKRWPKALQQGGWPEVLRSLPEDFLASLHRIRQLPGEFRGGGDTRALHDLVLLVHAAWEEYEFLCRERRVLDFIHLEEAALRLLDLESPGELLLKLDWRLKHLLVDEFQDTSDNQTALLCRLVAGWTPGDGRTITVVGDPKQSIYGWRQARLRLFLEARDGLPCGAGERLPLTPLLLKSNFRSTGTLIDWVNEVFGKTVMAEVQESGGLEFRPARAGGGREEGLPPLMALFQGEDSQEARRKEARWLAGAVREALKDLPPGERLAILLFSRTHLPVYLTALQEANLVPRVQEGLKLDESLVVRHLHNLARALVHPHDALAWATLFRSPWALMELPDLVALARSPGLIWPEKLAAWAKNRQCPASLVPVLEALRKARERVGREKLITILKGFLKESGAWQGIAAWEGALGVACARIYLKLLAEAEAGVPERTFLRADFALQETYQPPDPRAEDSPVDLLTVHRAKGLEFHTVFVPFLDWSPLGVRGDPPPFLLEEIPEEGGYVLALAPPAWEAGRDSAYELAKGLNKARLLAEARRLFYVAVTRAKSRLFLSGIRHRGAGPGPLAWLLQHYQDPPLPEAGSATWRAPTMEVLFSPEGEPLPELSGPEEKQEIPETAPFVPEPPPYRLIHPSELDSGRERLKIAAPGMEDESWSADTARARGEITHRVLVRLLEKKPLPSEEGVAAALMGLGVAKDSARSLAREILEEVRRCEQDPEFRRFLAASRVFTERSWEDQPDKDHIRRGRPDLVAFDGGSWWLVDFKTSRPPTGEFSEAWISAERERYRPQLWAYREIVAKFLNLPEAALRPALYFTACQKLVEF